MIVNRNDRTPSPRHETETEELKRLITLVMKQGVNWRDTAQKQTTYHDQLLAQFTQNRTKMEEQIAQLKQENTALKRQLAQQQQKHPDPIPHPSPQFPTKKHPPHQRPEQIETLLPMHRQYPSPVPHSPIHKLREQTDSQFTADQLCRLNSYLIEHNSTAKLLLEKMNYLLKLRALTHPSPEEETETISKTRTLLKQNKVVEEAQSVMKNSKKKYFESDGSSDIEEENNRLYTD